MLDYMDLMEQTEMLDIETYLDMERGNVEGSTGVKSLQQVEKYNNEINMSNIYFD